MIDKQPTLSYQSSGVDIDAGNQLIKHIKPIAKATNRPGVISGLGGFGGLFSLAGQTHKKPILVAATDGVGTKLMLANTLNNHDGIGIDLVAMCVNDLIVQGAEPLFFLDYYATGKLDIKLASAVIKGIGMGCQQAQCALIGGETAEMPGVYQNKDYDLAGFCVGIVDEENIIDGKNIKAGDVMIAIASSGVHANGFSLVRQIIKQAKPTPELLKNLLTPTKIYVKSILSLIKTLPVKGIAHITGGGLLENIPRVLPSQCGAVINTASWQMPALFTWLQNSGNLETKEMYRVFNCGVGMVVIVDKENSKKTIRTLENLGEKAWLLGNIETRSKTAIRFI